MEWTTLEKFPNYEINEFGDVRNKKTGTVRKPFIKNDYKFIQLRPKPKVIKNYYIHKLVAFVFCEKPKNWRKMVVKHKDEDKLNCHKSNLVYGTQASNIQDYHAYRMAGGVI